MKKIITLFQKYATGKAVSILFVLTMSLYAVMLLYSIPLVIAAAPHMKLFDMSPAGYSAEYASELLEAIGPGGRGIYLSTQLPLDFIYPGLFGVTFSLLLVWLFRKSFSSGSRIFWFAPVPVLAGFFDYLENIGIITMLLSFPEISHRVVEAASIFTILKSGFTIGFYVLLVIGFVSLVLKKIKTADS